MQRTAISANPADDHRRAVASISKQRCHASVARMFMLAFQLPNLRRRVLYASLSHGRSWHCKSRT
jgi:hypothetical protein